jgi:RES domain-containing protein
VTVYRLSGSKYPNNDGIGASIYGGRWNQKGIPIIYCGSSIAICALEVLVHSAELPSDMVLVAAKIPASLPITTVTKADIPPDWNSSISQRSTKNLGSKWASERRTAVLAVPSSVIPDERNYLLNPLHPDFARITFSSPKPFWFDPRLKK